jgi:hypothetical protein
MKNQSGTRAVALWLGVIGLCATGCHRADKTHTLPNEIPTPPRITFTGPSEGWPPRPQGRTNEVEVPYTLRQGALTDARTAELRQAALQNAQVRAALGERFAFITAAEVEPDKQNPQAAAAATEVRLTFFSYSTNVAVQVLMRAREVEKVERREGYQPPEGAEEIKAAIELARRDPRLREVVQNMQATAILTYVQQDRPGYGHRVLHVSFSAPGDDVPRYFALVDLTEQKVLVAGTPAGVKGGI